MNKKIIGFISILLLLISFCLYYYLQQQNKIKNISENKLTTKINISPFPTLTQKIAIQTTYQIVNQELIIKFKITSNQDVSFDGADLIFSYLSDNLSAIRVDTGKALDLCPKKSITPGKIEISCVNQLDNNQSGKINEELTTVYFKINKSGTNKLIIDRANTKFYFLGQQIPVSINPYEILIPLP